MRIFKIFECFETLKNRSLKGAFARRAALAVLALFLLPSQNALSQIKMDESIWMRDFAAARELAEKENKTLLLVFAYMPMDLGSKRLARNVLLSEHFKNFAKEKLVCAIVERKSYTERGKKFEALAEEFGVAPIPASVIIYPDGRKVRIDGYAGETPHEYVEFIKRRENVNSIPYKDIVREEARPVDALAWSDDFEAASKRAQAEGKPLLLLFTDSASRLGLYLNKTVFDTPAFRSRAGSALVCVSADFDAETRMAKNRKSAASLEALAEKYGVSDFPFIVLIKDGVPVATTSGLIWRGPEDLAEWVGSFSDKAK